MNQPHEKRDIHTETHDVSGRDTVRIVEGGGELPAPKPAKSNELLEGGETAGSSSSSGGWTRMRCR